MTASRGKDVDTRIAGRPTEVNYPASFASGMGAPFVFPEMWPLAGQLLDGSLVASLPQVAAAIRIMLERSHILAEGAGAAALAAALTGQPAGRKIVCVVSGGNIGTHDVVKILQGEIP